VISRDRRAGACLQAETGTDPGTGKPALAWWFDQDAIDAGAATDGWYALLTTAPTRSPARRPRTCSKAAGRAPWRMGDQHAVPCGDADPYRGKWLTLSNTTLGVLLVMINSGGTGRCPRPSCVICQPHTAASPVSARG
jgi:hypothetical protein